MDGWIQLAIMLVAVVGLAAKMWHDSIAAARELQRMRDDIDTLRENRSDDRDSRKEVYVRLEKIELCQAEMRSDLKHIRQVADLNWGCKS